MSLGSGTIEERQPRRTDIATSQPLPDRTKHLVPQLLLHHLQLFRSERVGEHVRVHCWEEVNGDEGWEGAEEGGLSGFKGREREV
jgi:hypothetical protein